MNSWHISLIIIIIISNLHCFNNCDTFKTIEHSIHGVDISHYQDNDSKIDWSSVSQNTNPQITFAYIRTTMGKDGKDKAFEYNFKEAQKHGIKVGVYHYYRPNERAVEQFDNFLKNTPQIGDMPPVLDIEEMSELGAVKLRQELVKFLQLVKSKYGINPIIYAHQRFYNTYLRNRFSEYKIWIARQNGHQAAPENNQMHKEPFLFDGRCPLIWQYSGTGTISGISGHVDLNITKEPLWD